MIRAAAVADIDAILDLAEARRVQYETYQPVFWRKAPDSREKQRPFLAAMLQRENVFALVHEVGGRIDGFLVGAIVPTPPVYGAGADDRLGVVDQAPVIASDEVRQTWTSRHFWPTCSA